MTKLVLKFIIFWLYFYQIESLRLDCEKTTEDIECFSEDIECISEDQHKCNITSDGIECFGCEQDFLDLKSEFERLSNNLTENPKLLNKFSLFFTSIDVIPENVFNDISFEEIYIYKAINLSSIDSKALISSKNTTKRLSLSGTKRLRDNPPQYNLYEAISSLVNLEFVSIELEENSVHSIPNNAFHANDSKQNNLKSITYFGDYNISSIGDYAFADSPLLFQIFITQIPINVISAHAFDSRLTTEQPLSVTLSDCSLTEQSFQKGIFSTLKRPLYLYLGDNQIRYIREEIFGELFSNEINTLDLMGNSLQCDDITSFEWLLKKRDQLKDRITSAYCENKTALWDLYIDTNDNSFASINYISWKLLLFFTIYLMINLN